MLLSKCRANVCRRFTPRKNCAILCMERPGANHAAIFMWCRMHFTVARFWTVQSWRWADTRWWRSCSASQCTAASSLTPKRTSVMPRTRLFNTPTRRCASTRSIFCTLLLRSAQVLCLLLSILLSLPRVWPNVANRDYFLKITTTCRVLYLSDSPERTQICCDSSFNTADLLSKAGHSGDSRVSNRRKHVCVCMYTVHTHIHWHTLSLVYASQSLSIHIFV